MDKGITHQRSRLDVGRAGQRNLYLLASAVTPGGGGGDWLLCDQRACSLATGLRGK